MSRAAMILAAGFGTRMGTLTRDRPKPLLEVGGRPLLAHALAAAGEAGPIVVNGHYRAGMLADWLARHAPEVRFSPESPDILDSGGGVKQALPILGAAPILTLNADAVWAGACPHAVLARAWRPGEMGALMLLVPRERAVGRQGGGDVAMAPDGQLTWDRGPGGLVHTGAQIIETGPFAATPDRVFSLRRIWEALIAEGRLHGVLYPGHWADVGHPEGLRLAEEMLRHDPAV